MRRALVIGIDDYPFAPLSGCVNDATAVAGLLERHHDGKPNFDVRRVLCPPDAVNRSSLRSQIDELLRDEADLALLYFSGHGTENNLGGYLVTPDAKTYDEGVSMTDVLTLVQHSPVQQVVIMLDCCHSGALGTVPALQNNATVLREGVSVLTASRATQTAVETGGMGLFTSLLVGALEGGAADVLGHVTAASVYAYVDQSLGAWGQRPLFKAHVSTLTSLRDTPPAVNVETLRRLPEWFPAAEHELPLDRSYEPDAEPSNPEHEAVFDCLQRCRAAKLVEPVGEDHMYYAAMNGKSCRLTPLGRHFWRLANDGRI